MNVQRLFKHRSNKQSAVVSGWLIKLSHVSTTAGFWSPFFSLYNVIYSYAFASIQGLCRGTRDSCHVVFIGIMVESLCCESFVNPKPFVLLFLHVSLFSGKSHRVQASSHCEKVDGVSGIACRSSLKWSIFLKKSTWAERILVWPRILSAQALLQPQTFHQLRAELAAIWSPHKDWRHLWRITKWAKWHALWYGEQLD